MRKKVYSWLGREFIALSCEGRPEGPATKQLASVFERFSQELAGVDLSLENVVRTRLWARDRESRNEASNERARILTGKARSAGSSYIAPDYFDSEARVALNLLAMRPTREELDKTLKEYEPPITPLRYLIYDSVIFLSGVTAVLPGLDQQLADIVPRITESLADAGSSWNQVAKVSCFLHKSERVAFLKDLFQAHVKARIPRFEVGFVDGFSTEGKLVEVEVTASL
jgi:enamine deaminase RidA (YjgF/YER057c/UK114 family)